MSFCNSLHVLRLPPPALLLQNYFGVIHKGCPHRGKTEVWPNTDKSGQTGGVDFYCVVADVLYG